MSLVLFASILLIALLICSLVLLGSRPKPRPGGLERLQAFNASALANLLSSSEREYLRARLPWPRYYYLHWMRTRVALKYLSELDSTLQSIAGEVLPEELSPELKEQINDIVQMRWTIVQLQLLAICRLFVPPISVSTEQVLDYRDGLLLALGRPNSSFQSVATTSH